MLLPRTKKLNSNSFDSALLGALSASGAQGASRRARPSVAVAGPDLEEAPPPGRTWTLLTIMMPSGRRSVRADKLKPG